MSEQTPRRRTGATNEKQAAKAADETPDEKTEKVAKPDAKRTRKQDDPRIGQVVDPRWTSVGFDDGSRYRCEGGRIVERTN